MSHSYPVYAERRRTMFSACDSDANPERARKLGHVRTADVVALHPNDERSLLSQTALEAAHETTTHAGGLLSNAVIQREMEAAQAAQVEKRRLRELLAMSVEREGERSYGVNGRAIESTKDLPALESSPTRTTRDSMPTANLRTVDPDKDR